MLFELKFRDDDDEELFQITGCQQSHIKCNGLLGRTQCDDLRNTRTKTGLINYTVSNLIP